MPEKEKRGFIMLQRSTMDHWLWKSSRVKTKLEAWIDLLMRANFDKHKEPVGFDLIVVKRGQILTSQEKLSEAWNWDRSSVRRYLELLKSDGMIEVETAPKWTMITLCNYETYNDMRPATQQQDNINATSTQHQHNTDNNSNNYNNYKNSNKEGRPQTKNDCIAFLTTELNIDDFTAEGFAENFFNYYESVGWKVGGKAKMKDWKAAMRGWVKRQNNFRNGINTKLNQTELPERINSGF